MQYKEIIQEYEYIGLGLFRPRYEKPWFMAYANNKGSDQSEHSGSLISVFAVRCIDCVTVIPTPAKSKIAKIPSLCSWVGRFESYLVEKRRRRGLYLLTYNRPTIFQQTCLFLLYSV